MLVAVLVIMAATESTAATGEAARQQQPKQQPLLRVGVIGAGTNTRRFHIPNLQKIPGVQVVSVVNRSPETTKAAADAFGVLQPAQPSAPHSDCHCSYCERTLHHV
jgi:predicted homoserine dehydrogenase-like protein